MTLWKLSGGPAKVEFKGWGGGVDRALLARRYRLLVDGTEVAAVDVAAGTKIASFTVPLGGLREGWHTLDIAGDPSEVCVPWFAYLQRGGSPVPQATMPVGEGTFSVKGNGYTSYSWAWVPSRFEPVTQPYPYAPRTAFAEALTRRSLAMTDIVPLRRGDIYRTRDTEGVACSMNLQAYYFSSLTSNEFPDLACLDGPRGQGSLAMATHLQVGRTGGVYFCDPWRMGHVAPDGTIRTIAGWRHRAPAPRPVSSTQPALRAAAELVGDWSSIPAERHGFHEAWGIAWDARTLVVDESAPPIPNNGTLEKPHVGGPVAFVSDSRRNRVVRLQFDRASHEVPVKVTEFLTGLNDPWDVVCVDGVLYVSERLSHRIAAYDATTGAFLRVVVSGAALATVTRFRLVQRLDSLAAIQAQRCVAPEGLYHLDGWLYFGSLAMAQVRRIHLATGELQVVCTPRTDAGSNFLKIAVSDGTFGPRGTVFATSWSIVYAGRPTAYLPGTGAAWDYGPLGSEGPGQVWDTLGYGCAVGVGQGRLVCSTSSEGLHDIYKAPAGMPTVTWERQQKTASAAYRAAGYELTHGPGGWGYFGLPMPWGVSADIDTYLTIHGHRRG